jgi:hypothetical protein
MTTQSWSHPWYIRLWQRCTLWSITVEGEIAWWASDDIHHRTRKIDAEVRLPKWLFKPICWLTKEGHSDYYGECVFCAKAMSGRKLARRG